MTFMQWKPEMSVGVARLDAQHKGLIALINQLGEEGTDTDMEYILVELERYVREHFRDEEQLMETAGYPELSAHKEEHQAFEDWLHSVKAAYGSGGEARFYIADDVNKYLRDWLANHILIIDMEYKGKLG